VRERLHVLGRDDAAARDQAIAETALLHELEHFAEQRHVRSRQDRERDHVHVLLQRRLDDLLRRLVETGVDHLHPGITQRRRHYLGPAVVAVEPRFSHENADLALHDVPSGRTAVEFALRRATIAGARNGRQMLALQLLARFGNPLIVLLLAAAAISAFTGDVASFVIITVVVALSVTLDFVQEYRAGRAAEGLKRSVALRATVVRSGKPREITADQIVPGDVVQLKPGGLV